MDGTRGWRNRARGRWDRLVRRVATEVGVVSTEYGLMLMLIALVLVAALTAFGIALADLLQGSADDVGGF